jgi:hypothetical protein
MTSLLHQVICVDRVTTGGAESGNGAYLIH